MTVTFSKRPTECFPKAQIREKQHKALDVVYKALERDYKHIVIAAPTGIGKSAIGVSVCNWISTTPIPGRPGGYYLVTQKLLQDQLEKDFTTAPFQAVSLKSATEYGCPHAKNCALGAMRKRGCPEKREGRCSYALQRATLLNSLIGVTNYPYFFTERTYVKQFPERQLIVADECHTLERQIIRFIDLTISEETLEAWTSTIERVPRLRTIEDFIGWVEESYLGEVKAKLEALTLIAEDGVDDKLGRELFEIDSHVSKITQSIELIKKDSEDWIYWQETDKKNHLISIARPLNAAPFTDMLFKGGHVKIYMSAYPGSKEVFCRSLGLEQEQVAWCSLGSTFDPKNRPIVMGLVGSMSMRAIDSTMPAFLRVCGKIFTKHSTEKGIVHTSSYKIGQAIYDHFSLTEHGPRLIFPENGDQRESKFKQHVESEIPTIIISPSMTEGFDFIGDLARWQIIAKMPYPSLSDKQVCAKKDQDPEWYAMETIKTFVQACGRICRSDEDWGATYVLDSDFLHLHERHPEMFPLWFSKAFVWPCK